MTASTLAHRYSHPARYFPERRPPITLEFRPEPTIASRKVVSFRSCLSANDAGTFSPISTPSSNQGGPFDGVCAALYLNVLVYIGTSENIVHVKRTIKGHIFSLLASFVLNCRH